MIECTPIADANDAFTQTLCVPVDHPCLAGHFPGHPLVPGVVLLEHVAQALRAWRGQRLIRVLDVKFAAPLLPGETAQLRLHGCAAPWHFRISRGDTVLARGRIEGAP